jgi:hypothetical protein
MSPQRDAALVGTAGACFILIGTSIFFQQFIGGRVALSGLTGAVK